MSKNTWSLFKWQYSKDYPSVWYLWLDETNTVRFMRSVEPCGFMPSVAPKIGVGDGVIMLDILSPIQIKEQFYSPIVVFKPYFLRSFVIALSIQE